MPLTPDRAKKIAAGNWAKRRANGTDAWAKDASEQVRRDYQTYLRQVEDKLSQAHILQEREFAGIIAATILLESHYLEINGSMAGYKGIPQHIFEEAVGVHLTQFFQLSKSHLGILRWNNRNRTEEGEDRWTITTHLQNYFVKYTEYAFIQVAANLGAEVRIPKDWDSISARDYRNWKRSSPNVLATVLVPKIGNT